VNVEIMKGTTDLETLKNTIEDLVRAEVDACGYILGRGYDVEITSCLGPEGRHTVFAVGIDEIEQMQIERPLQFSDLRPIVMESRHLRRALADLRQSIRSPFDTGFFCYRAVECLRQYFVEQGYSGDKASWDRLRDVLRVDKAWIMEIKKHSDAPRHGKIADVSGNDRVSMMKLAWKVVDRFSVYVHTGYKPLPEKDYPMLQLVTSNA
jgi:hypothetical protein